MRNLLTKSFLFGDEPALVTYDNETMEVLTWSTKDHHGNFIPGVKLNRVYNYRMSVDEKHIFKFDLEGVWTGEFYLDDICENFYRMFVEDSDIDESDWAYLNIRSWMQIEPNVLMEIGERLRHLWYQRYGGELHVAVDNVTIENAIAVPTVFYVSDENYVIADMKDVIVRDGSFGGGIFGIEAVSNSIYGTVETDLMELTRVIHRIRRNPSIHSLEVTANDTSIMFTAVRDAERSAMNSVTVPGDKFKISNK